MIFGNGLKKLILLERIWMVEPNAVQKMKKTTAHNTTISMKKGIFLMIFEIRLKKLELYAKNK